MDVLGFPESVALFPLVEESAVDGDAAIAALHGVLVNQRPMQFLAVAGQNVMKGAADSAFVVEVELAEAAQYVVVALDELVGRLNSNVEHGMGRSLALSNGRRRVVLG